MADKRGTAEDRFWAKVTRAGEEDCWLWVAGQDGHGYGKFNPHGQPTTAHRYSYVLAFGAVPTGLQVDHRCRVRLCVNPSHLQAVTNQQNAENTVAHRDSTTGARGVYFNRRPGRRKRYEVKVYSAGVTYYGGMHLTLEEAATAAAGLRSTVMTNNLPDRALLKGSE